MATKKSSQNSSWVDPDDAPEWTEEMFARAQLADGGKILREATGTVTKRGRPKSENPKTQVSVRLDPAVIAELKRVDPKWQVVLQKLLMKWARLQQAKRLKPSKLGRKTSSIAVTSKVVPRQSATRKSGT